jgi:hypothetical protein
VVLGRCPLEKVTAISAGRFGSADADDILTVQDIGRMELSRGPGQDKVVVDLRRLSLLRFEGTGFKAVWQSEPLNTTSLSGSGIAGTSWTSADVDADGLLELLLFTADSVEVLSFDPDTVRAVAFGMNGTWVEAAAWCDADGDGLFEVCALEVSRLDSGKTTRVLRLYRMTGAGPVRCEACSVAVNHEAEARVALLGSARLEDYHGVLPVVANIFTTLKPSLYRVLYWPKPDSLVLTDNPFPWEEWFTKTRVLPAGELSLFSVGDTLAAYGYFVPGTGRVPVGDQPPRCFAALGDGEWRLLPLLEHAKLVSGPACRFRQGDVSGWLELRDDLFRFHPGEIFRWR